MFLKNEEEKKASRTGWPLGNTFDLPTLHTTAVLFPLVPFHPYRARSVTTSFSFFFFFFLFLFPFQFGSVPVPLVN
jgi:hypothetical protein